MWSLSSKYTRRDADFERLKALDKATIETEKQYFSNYPEKWTVGLLVTGRLFRRRGAARALVKWDIEMAEEEGAVCKVEASEMGKVLYETAGFQVLGEWKVQVHGQEEELRY